MLEKRRAEIIPMQPIVPAREKATHDAEAPISRGHLIDELNGDLRREYQAIISYVIFSQVLKGAAYMDIAKELEKHAAEELSHAITVAKQIDYLGGQPASEPMPVPHRRYGRRNADDRSRERK